MVKFVIEPAHEYHRGRGRNYNVRVLTSVDGGASWWYCGIGWYVTNLTEAFRRIVSY